MCGEPRSNMQLKNVQKLTKKNKFFLMKVRSGPKT